MRRRKSMTEESPIIELKNLTKTYKNGMEFHAEDSGIYFLDEKGQTYRAVGVIKDITERKLAGEVLEKNEERYRAVAVQTGQLIYDYDVKSNCSSWVGAIEELTGYSFEEFQGFTPGLWADHVHPEDREKAIKAHAFAEKTGIFSVADVNKGPKIGAVRELISLKLIPWSPFLELTNTFKSAFSCGILGIGRSIAVYRNNHNSAFHHKPGCNRRVKPAGH